MNIFDEYTRKLKAQDILTKIDNLKTQFNNAKNTVALLVKAREELETNEKYSQEDLQANDLILEELAKTTLGMIKTSLESTKTLKGRINIQFDSVEVE